MPIEPSPALISSLVLAVGLCAAPAHAAEPKAAAAAAAASQPPAPSALDGELFYQLFLAENELRQGEPGTAYQIMLETARRQRSEQLFKRATDIALGARAGDQALAATKAWRQALPKSRQAVELQSQILLALGRTGEAAEPLKVFLELTPTAERSGAIASVPRLLTRDGKRDAEAAPMFDKLLEPWRNDAGTRLAALVATARIWLAAGEAGKALDLARSAQKVDGSAEGPALVALELMGSKPEAEALVTQYLERRRGAGPAAPRPAGGAKPGPHAEADALAVVELAYARRLTASQRFADALGQARAVTTRSPSTAEAWLLQGALLIELADPKAAQDALLRFVDLRQTAAPREDDESASADDGDDDDGSPQATRDIQQAYLMLAQTAEQQKDYAGAQAWLEKVGDALSSPAVAQRRASLLARQGRLDEGVALLQKLPERSPDETRGKALALAQVLRDGKRWQPAYEVLATANDKLNDDPDLLYEQALLAEKLARYDEMEGLLRRVMVLRPDQQHAYNALGYSLADRGLRLREARELIARALELAPGDPFIADSMGWVEFKLGRTDEALRLLRGAFQSRPDTEIAAHLGEVLWAAGLKDEARQVWRTGREKDVGNDVLQETLTRLKVAL